MDRLSSDLLHLILRSLESSEMVKSRRTSRRFLQVIDESKSNWQHFAVPIKFEEWKNEILEQWDVKSGSTLKEVDIKVKELEDVDSFIQTLLKSKETLNYFSIDSSGTEEERDALTRWRKEFPNLLVFKSTNHHLYFESNVELVRGSPQEKETAAGLQVLWDEKVFHEETAHLTRRRDYTANLTSLSIENGEHPAVWRELLKDCSRNLKHLRIYIPEEEEVELDPLEFPKLQVFELKTLGDEFPSWIKFPKTTKLLLSANHVPWGTPSVLELWIGNMNCKTILTGMLANGCPLLETLRIQDTTSRFIAFLLESLKARRTIVQNRFKVDGVEMVPLKTLIINTARLRRATFEEIRHLVDEVVDIEDVHDLIEVEI